MYAITAQAKCTLMPRSVRWRDGEHLTAGDHEVMRVARVFDLGESCGERALEDGRWIVGAQL